MSGEQTAFFYGTLMAQEIFFSVCYGTKNPPQAIRDLHTFTPAVLHDHSRHRVQFADYPAVVPEDGHSVRGIYATGLTDANMVKLNFFEGSEYEKTDVSVKLVCKDGDKEVEGDSKATVAYIFLKPGHLERGEWDFETFRKDRMLFWTRGDWRYDQDPNDKALASDAA